MGASSLTIDLGFFQLSIFRTLFIGLVCLVLYLMLLSDHTGNKIKINRDYGSYLAFWLLWALYALATAFWAKDIGRWLVATFYIFFGFFFFFLFSIQKLDLRVLVILLTVFVVSAFIQSLLGWYEIITGNYLFLDDAERRILYALVHAPVVFSYNINDFGTLMLVAFFACLMSIAYWKNTRLKIILYIVAINLVIMVFMSTSRANILALFCGLLFCFLIRSHKRLGLVVTIIGTMILGSILILNALSQSSGSDSIRINLIFDGLDFLADTAGFGIGAGQAEWWLRHRSTHAIDGIYNLHNWWVEVLTCYGIVIFIGYLYLYIKTFFTYFCLHKEHRVFDFFSLGCGLLVAFVLSCMSSSSLVTCEWMWMILPLVTAIGISAKSSNRNVQELGEIS